MLPSTQTRRAPRTRPPECQPSAATPRAAATRPSDTRPSRTATAMAIRALDAGIQQEAGEPQGVGRIALRALQFRPRTPDAALYASDGCWRDGSAMVGRRPAGGNSMTERQMFRAIVRGFGVFLAVSAVETYWFDLDRLLGLVSNTGYRYSISHEFLDASIQIVFAY